MKSHPKLILRLLALLLAALTLAVPALAEAAEAEIPDDVPQDELREVPEDELIDSPDVYGADDLPTLEEYPTLKKGDRDSVDSAAYIVFLQNRLGTLGYLAQAADGVYGENTRDAVAAFQARSGLKETGVADPATQELLYSQDAQSALDDTTAGADAEQITRVQVRLAQWGFLSTAIDGKYGGGTADAIQKFKQYILAVEGSLPDIPLETQASSTPFDMPVAVDTPVGVETPEEVTGEIDGALLAYISGDRSFQLVRQAVGREEDGLEVDRVQRRLKNLGYLYRANGTYGELTELAMRYFQRKHGLEETGQADLETQELLFSELAKRAEEYVFPYKLIVDVSDQRVYVQEWTGSEYVQIKEFKCSTGTKYTPTPLGTYQAVGKAGGEWYYFYEYDCYAKWAFRIVGGILFHSVTYNSEQVLNSGSLKRLGHRASHGCVRLTVDDAKWIHDNCPAGVTVVVQE